MTNKTITPLFAAVLLTLGCESNGCKPTPVGPVESSGSKLNVGPIHSGPRIDLTSGKFKIGPSVGFGPSLGF